MNTARFNELYNKATKIDTSIAQAIPFDEGAQKVKLAKDAWLRDDVTKELIIELRGQVSAHTVAALSRSIRCEHEGARESAIRAQQTETIINLIKAN